MVLGANDLVVFAKLVLELSGLLQTFEAPVETVKLSSGHYIERLTSLPFLLPWQAGQGILRSPRLDFLLSFACHCNICSPHPHLPSPRRHHPRIQSHT